MATHRKVDLQSPADLDYLVSNIKAAAQKKIDIHIPPSTAPADGDDAFTVTVDALVRQYITDTIKIALSSISINGLDASPASLKTLDPSAVSADAQEPSTIDPSDPAYEPYNPRLAEKLRSLYADLEAETTRVAELRREAPPKAADIYMKRLQEEVQAEAIAFETAQKIAAEARGSGPTELEAIKLDRQDRVKSTFETATANLDRLRNITETVATLERAQRAMQEVEKI